MDRDIARLITPIENPVKYWPVTVTNQFKGSWQVHSEIDRSRIDKCHVYSTRSRRPNGNSIGPVTGACIAKYREKSGKCQRSNMIPGPVARLENIWRGSH